jgi:N-acetylneuraminate synthase/pseudaminic acid synthase
MKFSFDQTRPFIIAEISANHAGNLDTCLELIRTAKKAGANAVKFQSYSADTITLNSSEKDFLIPDDSPWKAFRTLYKLYDEAKTPREWFPKLFEEARQINILPLSSVFSDLEVELLESLGAPCYKVASPEINNTNLIKKIAMTKKPIILSLGVASKIDLIKAITLIRKYSKNQIVVMQCETSYPAKLENCNLNLLNELNVWKDIVIGYSDHTQSNVSAIVAASKGATVFEKHLKISHSKESADSFFSADENDFSKYVKDIHLAFKTFGESKFRNESELNITHVSIYPTTTINKGDVFTEENLRIIRPGYGLHPKYWDLIINTVAKRDYKIGERISIEHLS